MTLNIPTGLHIPSIHPLVVETIALMVGIAWQAQQNHWLISVFGGLIAQSVVVFIWHKKKFSNRILTIIPFFLLGVLLFEYQHATYLAKATVLDIHKYYNVRASIADINSIDHPRFKYIFTVKTIALTPTSEESFYMPSGAIVQIYTRQHANAQVGDIIILKKQSLKICKEKNIRRYFIKEDILATCMEPTDIIIEHSPTSLARTLWNIKHSIFDTLRTKMSRKTFTYFSSIFLGYRKINKKENEIMKDKCRIWGISHYLARSGLHLVVFSMAWEWLFKFVPLPFIFKHLFLLIMTIIYSVLSWNSISFFRALLTLLIYKLCIVNNKPIHTLYCITLVTLLTLLNNPIQLFFLDFQLSFGMTFLLAWINHNLEYQKRTSFKNS